MKSPTERVRLGETLEDLVDKALSRFVPFSDIEYEWRENIDADVDFYIKENKENKIAIECKNWEDKPTQNSYIEKQILTRFKTVKSNVIKIVLGHVNVTEDQWKKYFRNKGIFLHTLGRQIQPEDDEAKKEDYVEYLISQLALLIVAKTGKFREDFLSKTTVKLIGGNEVIFDFDGEKKHWNLKTNNVMSQSSGNYYSKMIKYGPRKLDFVSSVRFENDDYFMIMPRPYTITQDSMPYFEIKSNSQSVEDSKIESYLTELPLDIRHGAIEELSRLGLDKDMEATKVLNESIEAGKNLDKKAELYGYDMECGTLGQFFKGILWKRF